MVKDLQDFNVSEVYRVEQLACALPVKLRPFVYSVTEIYASANR